MKKRPLTIERGKVPMHLLLMPCLAEVALVLAHGNVKPGRGPFNWRRQAIRESDMIDGAFRHILKHGTGERRDRQSKQRHLAHAVARLLIAMDADDHGKARR